MDPFWSYNGSIMPVNLSIKSVPDDLVEKLRKRAEKHHRSLQGELMTILEVSLLEEKRPLTAREALWNVKELNLKTAAESAEIIRRDRDRR